MFLVTFHGSRPTHDQDSKSATINNVYAYDDHWNLLSDAALGMGSSGLELAELRGMALDATGRLYVVNAYKKLNQIVRYTSSEEPPRPASAALFEYDRVFAQGRNAYPNPPPLDSIAHPFNICFDETTAFVSSQDTNVVTRLTPDGAAGNVAPYLEEHYGDKGSFLAGTFVASSKGTLAGIEHPPPNVSRPQGLDVELQSGAPHHSVRGVVFHDGLLYVADEPADAIKSYDSSGELESNIPCQKHAAPVHLALDGDHLYVGCSGSGDVLRIHLRSEGPAEPNRFPTSVEKLSAMAVGGDGFMYCGCRETKKNEYQSVYRSNLPVNEWRDATVRFGPVTPGTLWTDVPEFFLYVQSD